MDFSPVQHTGTETLHIHDRRTGLDFRHSIVKSKAR